MVRGNPSVRAGLLMGACLSACVQTVAASGILLDGLTAPKEGSIQLRDGQGRWIGVAGIPLKHAPVSEQSVTVAVIDSGVLPDHPQLQGLVAEQIDFTGEGPADRIGHGTVVAILLQAAALQLPPEERSKVPSPRIISAKVANADGSISKSNVRDAILWAVSRGAKVVNLSLGFPEGSDDFSELCFVIEQNPAIFFVAAAGNAGPTQRYYPASCDLPNLLSVQTADSWSGPGQVTAPGTVRLVPLP